MEIDRQTKDDHFPYIITIKDKSIPHYETDTINIHLTVSYSETRIIHQLHFFDDCNLFY